MATTDISLEPLFNQSSEGSGLDKKVAFTIVNAVGDIDHRSAVSVNSTPQEISLSIGKKSIEIQNVGDKTVYIGGSGVSSTNGFQLFSFQSKLFASAKEAFAFYVVCAAAETSELRVIEYD